MIRKKRYLAVGLLAMGISIIFSGQTAEAAEKKTIYNSPYVSFSPDGKAFTTCAGDQNYTWYDNGTTVNTGIKSSLRNLETGEHYYAIRRSGEVPVGYWKVVHRPGQCIHDGYPDKDWHGIAFGTQKCMQYYYSGWKAYCADCGEPIKENHIYMSREAAASIQYLDLGTETARMGYYYLCPFCSNLEQGVTLSAHLCKEISWNQYRIFYNPNIKKYNGYMDYSYHMYNNATEYEGQTVTPVTHLTENNYTKEGYVFIGWNTKPDGSGAFFADSAEIYNLSSIDWRDESTWTETDNGTVTLYAQWRKSESTLVIDAAGGKYSGLDKQSITQPYLKNYVLQVDLIQAPDGYQVAFVANGGSPVETIAGTKHFVEWMREQPFRGWLEDNIYTFTAPDGNVDTLKAAYQSDPITLPATTRDGWSFGGWYYDPDFSLPAGGAGDQIIPSKDMTLYAQWVDLRLQSVDNYDANEGKGAVDLSWSQSDQNNKTYLVYQKRENGAWIRVNSADDISSTTVISEAYSFEGQEKQYTIPYTGLYTIKALGAQGASYESYTGGYGGSVGGKFWLRKGDVLTYAVGGQNGYNGGGNATDYGNGGGMTSVVSDQKGELMIAGGGGGASPGGNGGNGGSAASVIDGHDGESGMAGGGAGYQGGCAGEKIVHHHTNDCYVDASYTPAFGSWDGKVDGFDCYADSNTKTSGYAHTKDDDPRHVIRVGWESYAYSEGTLWNLNGYSGLATNGNTQLNVSVHTNSWGSTDGLNLSKSKYRVLNQNGSTISSGSFSSAINSSGSSGSSGSSWENPDGSWGGSPDVRDFYGTFHFKLPEGTTRIYLYLDFYHNAYDAWFTSEITGLSFSGGRKLNCGMTEGQVLSSKPAYGGSNYVSSDALMYEMYSGVRSGSGYATLDAEAVGYQESLDLTGVVATDFAAPDKISDQVTKEPLDGKSICVTWQTPKDNGTDYYHKVESYLTGSTSMLCKSNITKNTLVSGVMGYYYLVDQKEDTVVTGNANYVQDPHVNVVTAAYNQYLHIAAFDVAGNISETTHILIDAKDVLWKIYTKQLSIDESVDNVYPAADKIWYVRADGTTPFTLKNEAYMDGTASRGYQLNETIYETVSDGSSVARNIIRTSSTEIADTSIRTDANGLSYSTDGTTALQQYSYSYTVRSNKNRDLMGVQKFTISRDLSGQTIQVIPVAEADKESDKVYSAHELDEKNKITLIADGEAPVIRGLEIMEDRDLIDRRDGSITIRASAEDELSGVKDFYIVISNSDNAVMKTYTPDENGYINITITNDEPIFSGDFTLLGYAVDNVGNENSLSYGTTEFALASSVERILEPHDPIFKCGESGILTFTTWGYADRVEVIFPESMTALDPTLNKVYDYTDCPGYMITEHLQFMVPLYTPENQNLEITVRAYKGDKKLEDHPTISVIGVSGTVLDEFRTRLR